MLSRSNIIVSRYFILLLLILCYFSSISSAIAQTNSAGEQWQVWRSNKTLSVSYQVDPLSGLNIIKAHAVVHSTLSGFMLFLQDTQHIPDWLANAQRSEVIKQISPYENIFITYFDTVWPVTPRNMVLHSTYQQLTDGSISITVNDAAQAIPSIPQSIRMTALLTKWHIMPLPEHQISINYQVQVDPNGDIPHWLINKLALKAMWQTLKNIEQQLPKSHWQQQSLTTIKEKSF